MATKRTGEDRWDDVLRQLGRLEAGQDRAAEDRAETREAIKEWHTLATDLRGAVSGLSQTVQSTATQIMALNNDKCGQRLDAIEKKNEHYDRVIGRAETFIWRVLAYVVSAALVGAGAVKLLEFSWK